YGAVKRFFVATASRYCCYWGDAAQGRLMRRVRRQPGARVSQQRFTREMVNLSARWRCAEGASALSCGGVVRRDGDAVALGLELCERLALAAVGTHDRADAEPEEHAHADR